MISDNHQDSKIKIQDSRHLQPSPTYYVSILFGNFSFRKLWKINKIMNISYQPFEYINGKAFLCFFYISHPQKKIRSGAHSTKCLSVLFFYRFDINCLYIFFLFYFFFVQHTQLHTRFFIYFFLPLAAYANVFIHIYFLRKNAT